ncbi:D-3-phosphoglycerate dehydrogenase [Aquipluma nitroreducens]|uniref:D-3-phosphoglycerate dehydrogenase n=1 Tax=Aquipluma nitroreducens TaxID=2010828 RepID=A0A5K7S5Y6_9BACT|nr:NAD(P)-dependent oxidoreductase [Aquipluma nitroreducens]BBE16971.1 D-3-phosphoglycerate dehydrogenase [Aquipluma nitroreducens]
MKRVLIATEKPFAPAAVNQMVGILEQAGYEVKRLEKYASKAELLDAVKDVNALIVRSDIVDRAVLDAAKELQVVVRAGSGFDNLDLVTCTEKGMVAMNTPGQNSNAVAELAIGMMIFMSRGQFKGVSGTELKGKTIGVYGCGNIGRRVARIAQGLGMKVIALDPCITKVSMEPYDVKVVQNVAELFSESDFLSLHIPANEKTKKSVNFDMMNKMPKGATIINTARKEVIDEDGLKKMLEERPDFKYISDIAPTNHDELAGKFDFRYYSTPKKQGAETSEANVNAGVAAAEQIVAFFESGDQAYRVNK